MTILEITPPANEPVDLDEAKAQLRVDTDDEDALIDGLISSARAHVEAHIRRRLITQVVELRRTGLGGAMPLPVAPIQSIDAVTYLDTDGAEQTLAADQYRLDRTCQPWVLVPAYGVTWPPVMSVGDSVGIRMTVGYGAGAAAVPAGIRAAIRMLIAHMYENRDAVMPGAADSALPLGVKSLLAPHIFWV